MIAHVPNVGDKAPDRVFGPITKTDIVRYAGASGDFNPIHHDEEFAAAAGFPSVFSVGMLQAALLGTYVTDWLGPANVRRFKVRFLELVWPGDLLRCSGEVTNVAESAGGTVVTVQLLCTRQVGGLAVSGSADFLLNTGAVESVTVDAAAGPNSLEIVDEPWETI